MRLFLAILWVAIAFLNTRPGTSHLLRRGGGPSTKQEESSPATVTHFGKTIDGNTQSALEWGIHSGLLSLQANTNLEWTLPVEPWHKVRCSTMGNGLAADVDLALHIDPHEILCASTKPYSEEECSLDGFTKPVDLSVVLAAFDDVNGLVLRCTLDPIQKVQLNQPSRYFGLALGAVHLEILNVADLLPVVRAAGEETELLTCSLTPHYFGAAEFSRDGVGWRTALVFQNTSVSESQSLETGRLPIPANVTDVLMLFSRPTTMLPEPTLKLRFVCATRPKVSDPVSVSQIFSTFP